jgi:hypothetical protein
VGVSGSGLMVDRSTVSASAETKKAIHAFVRLKNMCTERGSVESADTPSIVPRDGKKNWRLLVSIFQTCRAMFISCCASFAQRGFCNLFCVWDVYCSIIFFFSGKVTSWLVEL